MKFQGIYIKRISWKELEKLNRDIAVFSNTNLFIQTFISVFFIFGPCFAYSMKPFWVHNI